MAFFDFFKQYFIKFKHMCKTPQNFKIIKEQKTIIIILIIKNVQIIECAQYACFYMWGTDTLTQNMSTQ